MNKRFISLLVALTITLCNSAVGFAQDKQAEVQKIETVSKRGPFQPNWKSLENYQVPAWYQDAKFGIFIHWGVYSVPSFGNEWYPRRMYGVNADDIRFTTRGAMLYAMALDWPASKTLTIKS